MAVLEYLLSWPAYLRGGLRFLRASFLWTLPWSAYADTPVQIFILAGQSNMEGKAKVSLLEYQAAAPETRGMFQQFRAPTGWRERDDVWIKFLDRHGALTVGYGSPDCIGPELQFGFTVGDQLDAPVLLIKTAWGGKSLYRDFRSPRSGLPKQEVIDALLRQAQADRPDFTEREICDSFGESYREMLREIRATVGHLGDYLPGELAGRGYEFAAFVWFQGWNDMIDAGYTAEYAANMVNLIRDIRDDLGVPALPFVIGQLGVGGADASPNPGREAFQKAQASVAALPDFHGTVALVQTDQFWDEQADAVFQKGWKEHQDEWNKVGSDWPFHYLGSAKTMCQIGHALAESALVLCTPSSLGDPVIRTIEGWEVKVDPQLLSEEHGELGRQALEALANHLQRVKYIVPDDRVAQLVQLPIWIDLNHELGGMQYHPDRGWLLANGYDPRLAKHVHIPRADQLLDRGMWAKHPYVVLHELAHAYHDQVLGFEHAPIREAFESARDEASYERVLLYTGEVVRHYGMSNEKEYFAEATEAYFGVNDFYPFVRAELKAHDPRGYAVLEQIWGPVR